MPPASTPAPGAGIGLPSFSETLAQSSEARLSSTRSGPGGSDQTPPGQIRSAQSAFTNPTSASAGHFLTTSSVPGRSGLLSRGTAAAQRPGGSIPRGVKAGSENEERPAASANPKTTPRPMPALISLASAAANSVARRDLLVASGPSFPAVPSADHAALPTLPVSKHGAALSIASTGTNTQTPYVTSSDPPTASGIAARVFLSFAGTRISTELLAASLPVSQPFMAALSGPQAAAAEFPFEAIATARTVPAPSPSLAQGIPNEADALGTGEDVATANVPSPAASSKAPSNVPGANSSYDPAPAPAAFSTVRDLAAAEASSPSRLAAEEVANKNTGAFDLWQDSNSQIFPSGLGNAAELGTDIGSFEAASSSPPIDAFSFAEALSSSDAAPQDAASVGRTAVGDAPQIPPQPTSPTIAVPVADVSISSNPTPNAPPDVGIVSAGTASATPPSQSSSSPAGTGGSESVIFSDTASSGAAVAAAALAASVREHDLTGSVDDSRLGVVAPARIYTEPGNAPESVKTKIQFGADVSSLRNREAHPEERTTPAANAAGNSDPASSGPASQELAASINLGANGNATSSANPKASLTEPGFVSTPSTEAPASSSQALSSPSVPTAPLSGQRLAVVSKLAVPTAPTSAASTLAAPADSAANSASGAGSTSVAVVAAAPAASGQSTPTPMPDKTDPSPGFPPAHAMLDSSPATASDSVSAGQAARLMPEVLPLQMQVGVHTSAFGNVQVHTVIDQSQVGISIRGDHDLARWFSSEVGGLETGLKNQHLNLTGVDFSSTRSGVQTATGFQQGQPRQSFSQTPGSYAVTPADAPPAESAKEPETIDSLPAQRPETRVSILV